MITPAQLVALGIDATRAAHFAQLLETACARYSINTPLRISAFLAEAAFESTFFARLEESLYYTDAKRLRRVFRTYITTVAAAQALLRNPKALAVAVYSNRLGNGDAASGDGWRFIGRGLLMLTGLANYAAAALGTGRPYVEYPELLALPPDACLSAAWFWAHRGLNRLADAGSFNAITRRLHGPAMLGQTERRQLYDNARVIFA